MAKITAYQRVQRAHVWLMNNSKYCLFSGIFLIGQTEVKSGIPTAYTDGVNVKYGKEFVESLDEKGLRAVVLHENMHKAFKHLFIWKELYKKDARKANMACDYVINQYIYDSDEKGEHVKLPEFALLDVKYKGMDSQQVFNLLVKNSSKSTCGGAGEPNGDQGDGQGDGQGGEGQRPLDEHDWEAAKKFSESKEGEKISQQIESALRQGAIVAGRMGNKSARSMVDAMNPQIRWQDALRDFLQALVSGHDMSTWRRPSRRWVDQGVYLPSSVSESMGPIVVGVDTSGSIDNEVLGVFLAEVAALAKAVHPERLELLYWDTAVERHESYEDAAMDNLIASTKPAGGGGTNAACVPKYIAAKHMKPECAVLLTDGYVSSWGNWHCPLLVCCLTDVVAPVGKTVRLRM